MIPPKRPTIGKATPPVRKPQKPTDEEMQQWKKKNPGQLHPYWIERYRHYHQGKKFVAKAGE